MNYKSSCPKRIETKTFSMCKVFWKCFEDSPHVGHMQKYPREYLTELQNFLVKIGGAAIPKKCKQSYN